MIKPKGNNIIVFPLFAVFSISFAYLTKLVLGGGTRDFDQIISIAVYGIRSPLLTSLMKMISFVGDLYMDTIFTIIIFFILFKRHKSQAWAFLLLMSVTGILDAVLKQLFHLPRPQISPMEIETSYTFPSGHAMGNFVLYFLIVRLVFRHTTNGLFRAISVIVSLLMILLIGFSRVYLGVHYPLDVLGGYLAGLTFLSMAKLISNSFRLRKVQNL